MGLGLHGGGVGTIRFLVRHGARVMVTDLRSRVTLAPSLRKLAGSKSIQYVLGRHRKQDFLAADVIIKNPGVPAASPYLKLARARGIPITTDIGIFFKMCPATVIGVSGTRGKSTTAHLIWKFLSALTPSLHSSPVGQKRDGRRRRVFLGGNIRISVLEFAEKLHKDDVVVLELSSFQLEDIVEDRVSPQIAVLTNIFRDHLNRHRTMRGYLAAKKILFQFQKSHDYLFLNPHDPMLRRAARHAPSQVVRPALQKRFRSLVRKNLGAHYEMSVALAVAVARHFGVPFIKIEKVLQRFHGLEGRQEHIGRMQGVTIINDTTATIPEAAAAAIVRFRPLAKRIILIAGGSDKKLQFVSFAHAIKKDVDFLILLPGTATAQLKRALHYCHYPESAIHEARTMQEAVRVARARADTGGYLLLSPGAASFGLFQNEFDRGEQFKKAVKKQFVLYRRR